MDDSFRPPGGPDSAQVADFTPNQFIAVWLDLIETTDQLLMAGLARELGPRGDVKAAYRKWFANHRKSHEQAVERMMSRLNQEGS